MQHDSEYIPALRYRWLTSLYDPIIAITTREKTFKKHLVEIADIRGGINTMWFTILGFIAYLKESVMRCTWFVLFLLIVLPYQSYAGTDQDKIGMILKAIVNGWEQADGTPFREHFLDYDGARYVESGGQNIGLTDLIEHHVKPEGKSLKLDLNFDNPVITVEGDFAWVIVDTEINATIYKTDRKIHNKGFETIILRKMDNEWKVLHTHSSSRPVRKN